jgi:aminoglycoside phosphotransferase (APT) family kinase protein
MSDPFSLDELLARARHHGLSLSPEGARLDQGGLDFVALHARDTDGTPWIVRAPRRPDVVEGAAHEARALAIVRGRLPVAVPNWRIHTGELIAYPRLGGTPVITLDTGAPVWNVVDPKAPSDAFVDDCARLYAALQAIADDGLRTTSVAEARAELAEAIAVARELLAPSPHIVARWERFLGGDTWPSHLALIHGDLHPGHMLVTGEGRLTGVIDWTEAKVTDPGADFAVFLAAFGRASLERMLARFEHHGGRTWSRAVEHAEERWAIFPAQAALWSKRTGSTVALEFARAELAASS